jgi:peroxiredoxin
MRSFIKISFLFFFMGLLFADKAPHFKLKNLDGKFVDLDSLLQIGPVVVDFWATWCKYCDDELDLLNDIYKEIGDTLFTVVAISIDNPKAVSKIRSIVSSRKWKFPVLLDSDKRVKKKYKVVGLPTLYVLNEEGEIVWTRMGYHPSQREELKKLILKILRSEEKGGKE